MSYKTIKGHTLKDTQMGVEVVVQKQRKNSANKYRARCIVKGRVLPMAFHSADLNETVVMSAMMFAQATKVGEKVVEANAPRIVGTNGKVIAVDELNDKPRVITIAHNRVI